MGSTTHGNQMTFWGIGEDMVCQSGAFPPTGCTDTIDVENVFGENLVGKLTRGNNTGASIDINSTYAHDFITDVTDAGTLGSTYLDTGMNSSEDSNSIYELLMICGTQNYGTFQGFYLTAQQGGPCMGPDINGNPAIGVKAGGDATSQLFIGGIYGNPLPGIGPGGNLYGIWNFHGSADYEVNVNTTATPGATTIWRIMSQVFSYIMYLFMILLILMLFQQIQP